MAMMEDVGRTTEMELACLRELVESLDQMMMLIASDLSRLYYVSPLYERMTGYSCESLYEDPGAGLAAVHEQDRNAVRELLSKRIAGIIRGRSETEYRFRKSNGEIRWFRSILTPVVDKRLPLDRLAVLTEDITERKQKELALKQVQAGLAHNVELRTAELSQTIVHYQQEIEQRTKIEAELRRTEGRFRRLFEANIIGVIFSDIYGNLSEANGAFLKMTGYSREDLPLRWDKMTPPEWSHTSEMAVQQIVLEGSVTPWEKEYLRKDGTRVPVLIGGALLDREAWQCVFFAIDLSRRKQAEEEVREVNLQLEHASRLSVMGEMLADMAHEIHQPLGVIANYANGSLRRLKKGELKVGALKKRLREIAAESLRVAEVLRRIREFIRRREPERKSVNVNIILMDVLQFTRLERREHRVAVINRLDPDLPEVQADRVQITQVLVNLILNAIHAVARSERGMPKILVSTYVNDAGDIEISVADNGPGIAADDLPRIFDRFFTTKSGGLGLGLPISRSIIESHGGKLWCDSTPGESAIFRVSLPPHRAPTEPESK